MRDKETQKRVGNSRCLFEQVLNTPEVLRHLKWMLQKETIGQGLLHYLSIAIISKQVK